jgi:hypothetical protein
VGVGSGGVGEGVGVAVNVGVAVGVGVAVSVGTGADHALIRPLAVWLELQVAFAMANEARPTSRASMRARTITPPRRRGCEPFPSIVG